MTAIGAQVARGARGVQSRGIAYHGEDWEPSVTEALGQGDNSPNAQFLLVTSPCPREGFSESDLGVPAPQCSSLCAVFLTPEGTKGHQTFCGVISE